MKLNAFHIQNFRRLKDTVIDLEDDISIFVGANNSGKTSATQALDIFVNGAKEKLSIFDFSSDSWNVFTDIGDNSFSVAFPTLPTITVDLWFQVDEPDLHRVSVLLPGLEWEGSEIGLRIQFQPRSTEELLLHFREAKAKAEAYEIPENHDNDYQPWPGTLLSFLEKEINAEYHFGYYALDRDQFDLAYKEGPNFEPKWLRPELAKGILKSILKVDCLNAQRHLSDSSGDRAEDLSRCLSRFYKRNLEKRDDDHDALKALSTSEQQLNNHLARVFEGTLTRISDLGYPGFNNPTLIIKSALNPTMIMTQDTRVHYALDNDAELTLPDSYNGLGFKNLIYMVVEILDLQNRWKEDEENRAALHLIFIEEPEAHLHAQLQQVFINKVLGLLQIEGEGDDGAAYKSQVVITTHSSHILYERGFKPIRYFRRESAAGIGQFSSCLNLSEFYRQEVRHRDFLAKYLKLTHCDLFFADAAVLVEGNVERLLIPLMIKKVTPELQSSYLSILEVSGAFAHQFKSLIQFLGIVTLVITDVDSVHPPAARPEAADAPAQQPEDEQEEDDEPEEEVEGGGVIPRSKCIVSQEGAHTSNQTLRKWLPRKNTIAELMEATLAECTQEPNDETRSAVHVTYQKLQPVRFNGVDANIAGRTFEEAFGLENADWCQNIAQKKLGLRFRELPQNIESLAQKLHIKVSGSSFDKTKFALNLMTKNEADWTVPVYIRNGLTWLRDRVNVQQPAIPAVAQVGHPEEAEAVA